jgi:putative tricarboxylic transport membrane protein
MKFNDTVIGGVLLVLSVALMLHVSVGWDWLAHNGFTGFPRAQPGKPGPALFPFTLGILFFLCSVVLLVRGLRSGTPWLELQPWLHEPGRLVNWLAVIAAIVAYQFLSEWIGFLPLALVGLMGLMKLLGVRTRTAALASLLAALFIHTLFVKLLLVPLPWGLLEPIAW